LVGPAGSLQATLITGVPLILLFLFATRLLEQAGLLHRFEYFAFDTFSRAGKVPQSENIVLVVIDDDDYQTLFGGRSPLSAGPDQNQPLLDAIKTITDARAKVIGVDLDTSDAGFKVPADFPTKKVPADSPTEVVWARDGRPPRPTDRAQHRRLPAVIPGRFVGDNPPLRESRTGDDAPESHRSGEHKSGISVVVSDDDGVVRCYWRMVTVHPESYTGDDSPHQDAPKTLDTFPWAIVREFCRGRTGSASLCKGCNQVDELHEHAKEHAEPVVIRFSSDKQRFQRIRLSMLSKPRNGKQNDAVTENPGWANKLFHDKIVLIGGEYRAGRDVHTTPVGERFGVEILADIIEMEIKGRSIGEGEFRWAAAYDVLTGLILLLVQWRFRFHSRGRWVVLATIGSICLLTVVGSWLIFDSLAFWFNLAAPLAAVLMHLVWERESNFRETKMELEECRHEIIRLKKELSLGRP